MYRVIHIGPHPDTVGGMQSVLRTIAQFSIGSDEVRVIPTWNGPNTRSNLRLMLRAARTICASGHGALIHIHISNGGAWIREGALVRWGKWSGHPVVVSLHGDNFPSFARRHPQIVRAVVAPADQLTCLSPDAHAALSAILPRMDVTVLPNPVAIDHESPPAEETPPVVLFAGVVGYRKGVDVLTEAWQALLARGVDGECRIVGPLGDFHPAALERMHVEAPVRPTDIRALIRAARVVVLPSRSEGMPMILAEALASGRPFVATPVGGIPELTPSSGNHMLVPVENADELSAALELYLRNRHFAGEMGRIGQRFCSETRSPSVIDRRLREIYDRI
jgi:glycosyltransferase involved in cell wall biosynthesis